MKKTRPIFEDFIKVIDQEILKRRAKWSLSSLSWMDFDDVSQIIRIHVFEKWDQYNYLKPIQPWLNSVITNQIKNLIRNNYGNYTRPCLKCAAAEGQDGCRIYNEQCSACPLFNKWEKKKKDAYNLKVPISMENVSHETDVRFYYEENIESNANKLHKKMKEVLKPLEYRVYEGLFINNKSEEEVAKDIGYISNEKNRAPGYKQLKNMRKKIILKAKKLLSSDQVDII